MAKKRNRGKGKQKGHKNSLAAYGYDDTVEFELEPSESEKTGTLSTGKSLTTTSYKSYSCYEKHPVLDLGGGKLLGASCLHPADGYDIYVGFDHGMRVTPTDFPWNPKKRSKIVEVYFPIQDMGIPKDVVEFKKMITWLVSQLALGKKIHMGCIGGHGRTGTVLAALVAQLHGDTKAGEWVRKNYCTSAIESEAQIKFLEEHYKIERVKPSKSYGNYGGSYGGSYAGYYGGGDYGKGYGTDSTTKEPRHISYAPLPTKSIWSKAIATVRAALTNDNVVL